MKRNLSIGATLLVAFIALGVGQVVLEKRAGAQAKAGAGGKVQVALVRSGKILAKKSGALRGGTTSLNLKVSPKLKPGGYSIQLTFTPAGSTHAIVKSLRLKVVRTKKGHKKVSIPLRGKLTLSSGAR